MRQGLRAMLLHGEDLAGAIPWRLVPLVTSLALAAFLAVAADPDPRAGSLELQVKAAFLYNFAKFVEWPSDTRSAGSSGSLAFCVFGDEPLFTALTQSLVGKTINGRALVAAGSPLIVMVKVVSQHGAVSSDGGVAGGLIPVVTSVLPWRAPTQGEDSGESSGNLAKRVPAHGWQQNALTERVSRTPSSSEHDQSYRLH